VDGRVARLEHPERPPRVGDRDALDDDPDPLRDRLDPRWSRVVPDRLLAGARLDPRDDHAHRSAPPTVSTPSAQRPTIARWPMSTTNPRFLRTDRTSAAASSRSTSHVAPQARQ